MLLKLTVLGSLLIFPRKKALGCKWAYRIKLKYDGIVERYKARLIILGNHQVEGEDYTETFALVTKPVLFKPFLLQPSARVGKFTRWTQHFSPRHGDLAEEVYMKLPLGFHSSGTHHVCLLKKSLYGLRQAPRCWFSKLSTALSQYGFKHLYANYSLFTYAFHGILCVLIYVDDLIITEKDSSAISHFKLHLSRCFHLKDLGPLNIFSVLRSPEMLPVSTSVRANMLWTSFTKQVYPGLNLPSLQLSKIYTLATDKGLCMPNPASYRCLVGCLLYLTITRPKLAYSVNVLAQFMQPPRLQHWKAVF